MLDTEKWFAFVDISKAYDNVDLRILDEAIRSMNPPLEVLEEWRCEYEDLKVLNMDVFGKMIKRSNGLPQGSELAPALFNIYTTYILNQIDEQKLLPPDVEIAIFADNWVIFFPNYTKAQAEETVLSLNGFLYNKFKLQFTMEEAEYANINQLERPMQEKKKLFVVKRTQEQMIKFLGVKWYIYNGKAYVKATDYFWNFPNIRLSPAFVVIKMIKKFIVPKFRYYYNYISIVNPDEGARYLAWFKEKIRVYLQKNLNMLNIQMKLVENIIHPGSVKIFNKFLCPYLATNENIVNPNGKLTAIQLSLLEKLKEGAKYILNNDVKVGIYQMSNFLFSNKSATTYFMKNVKCLKQRERNRTWMVLDIMYYGITAEKRLSTLIFQEQEKYMNKTLRKKCYKIF